MNKSTHTPAPAQRALLTDDQIDRIRIRAEKDSRRFGRTVDIPIRADLLLGLLSKLRAPVADERKEISGVTLDGCLETLFRVGEHLGIDYAESRKQPGAPSSIYIKAIEERVSQAMNAAREEAAKLMDQTSRSSGATLIRALASAPVAGEAVAHAVISYGRIQRLVVNEESAHEYAEQQRLNAEAAGWDAKAHVRPLVYGDAAPQASEAVRKEDVATVLNFIFEHFGKPFNACDLPGYVVAAVRRLEHAALSAQPGAQKNGGSDGDH